MSAKSTPYRFRPRFVGVAFVSLSLGVTLVAAALTVAPDRLSSTFSLISGIAGLCLGYLYLRSPVWKLAVDIQETDLVIWSGTAERLRLPWSQVSRVVVDPDHELCFVDGGSPEKSLLVPGPGAQASYVIAKRRQLINAILSHVPSEIVQDSSQLQGDEACSTVPSP